MIKSKNHKSECHRYVELVLEVELVILKKKKEVEFVLK